MKRLLVPPVSLAALVAAILPSTSVRFTDVTVAAGIKFHHNAGKTGKKYLPETMGSGVAFFDADGDGLPDILLVHSKDWTTLGRKSQPAHYRNNRTRTVTAAPAL